MRTVLPTNITRKTHRAALEPRKAAYYRELSDGLHIGYRRMTTGNAGRWLVRERQGDGSYKERSIGVADDVLPADGVSVLSFDQAVAQAAGAAVIIHTGMPKLYTAIDEWLRHKASTLTNPRSVGQAAWMAKHLKASFADVPLDKIKANDIDAWHKNGISGEARSARATADRKLAALKGALTRAVEVHGLKIEKPWSVVQAFGPKTAGTARTNRLTPTQIRALIDAADPDMAAFVALAAETGARPSELYTARCRAWDGVWLDLNGKTGPRTIRVSAAAQRLLQALLQGVNDPDRHILIRSNGLPWRGSTGDTTQAFTAARIKAGLPTGVVMYDLRHSFISDALERGAPAAMVATHTGTSLAMLQNSYAKFLPKTADLLMGGLSGA